MKNFIYLTLIMFLFMSCKKETKVKTKPLTISQEIANAHGFENWKNVSEVQFTFAENRNWIWKPKSNDVTLTSSKDTISYNRKNIDSLSLKTDRSFINDKFWLLIPFQLVWDEGITISESIKTEAPISKTKINKITLAYSNEGGYTPGDAYDIYFDNNYLIKEWVFRKGNKPEAGLINTFENYQDFNGIKIALDHKKEKGNWNLKLSNIKVILE